MPPTRRPIKRERAVAAVVVLIAVIIYIGNRSSRSSASNGSAGSSGTGAEAQQWYREIASPALASFTSAYGQIADAAHASNSLEVAAACEKLIIDAQAAQHRPGPPSSKVNTDWRTFLADQLQFGDDCVVGNSGQLRADFSQVNIDLSSFKTAVATLESS